MMKLQIAVLIYSCITLQVLARPQNVQIEKQVMIEIPFGDIENGVASKQAPLYSLIDQYFNENSFTQKKNLKDVMYINKQMLQPKNNKDKLHISNNVFIITKIKPRNKLYKKEFPIENPLIQRRMSSNNNEIVELIPPAENAPIISYSKQIKQDRVLEEQLKHILAEYENLPKYNSRSFDNIVKYEMKLKDKDQGKIKRGRSQKSMKLKLKEDELPEEDLSDNEGELSGEQIENDGSTKFDEQYSTDLTNMFIDTNFQPENVQERFVLKKGGIAIVGPKGIATAEKGGTAIVGPNGVAYTKPNGVAIVGPGSRVVSLPMEADLNKLVYELYKHQSKHPEKLTAEGVPGEFVLNNDGSTIKQVFLPFGAKIVATGPVIYHDNAEANNDVSVIRFTNSPQVIGLPYYGGAKGQVLQITTDQNGAILSQAIVPEPAVSLQPNTLLLAEDRNAIKQQFAQNFDTLQTTAKKLIELQQKVQRTGQLHDVDRQSYTTNLALLGQSASTLAQLQGQGSEDLTQFFAAQKSNTVNRQGIADDEEDVGEESSLPEENNDNNTDDSVVVNGPPDTASVAEAKPLGVAIAGEGGVASSKPVGHAIVGPGGLAIARPVATALAGVDPGKVGFGTKIPSVRLRDRVDAKLANRFN